MTLGRDILITSSQASSMVGFFTGFWEVSGTIIEVTFSSRTRHLAKQSKTMRDFVYPLQTLLRYHNKAVHQCELALVCKIT